MNTPHIGFLMVLLGIVVALKRMIYMKTMISAHISYDEAVKPQKWAKMGIDNTPDEMTLKKMKVTANAIFEPIRKHFGKPLLVTSFYRSPAANASTPGHSPTSQHMKGEALDMDADATPGLTNEMIFEYIKSNLIFDQVIAYGNPPYRFIHCSFAPGKNRKQVLHKP